ncbi:hypothetical protein [Flavihumibacter sp. ZG627]|uniref:hypothetical protein n=1 Tax=Flavihumibacter sp. ZG627 TaxID=1463156 RepID=UPI00057FEBD5|nr:hypothetical protein [Flavihumibacter sp. ZG627]KIC91334.1 hypothetical protein HY58_03540 [Flavihumibacter sp. ZG627]
MKKILYTLLLFVFSQSAFSQYYYKDLVTTQQANDQYALLQKNGIKKVTLESFDGNSSETGGFTGVQQVDLKKGTVTTTTSTTVIGDSYLKTTYNAKGLLSSTEDSAQNASSRGSYEYDSEGRLVKISSTNSSDNVKTTETHSWRYSADGKPTEMIRVRNNSDTTRVTFTLDENGNVVEEKVIRPNLPIAIVYYYYDAQKRLTDIVRFNAKANRLLPDYMFEYDEAGRLKKMVVIPEGSNEYQTWYYQYTPNGLKRMELCYDKQQQLLGKVQYEYDM